MSQPSYHHSAINHRHHYTHYGVSFQTIDGPPDASNAVNDPDDPRLDEYIGEVVPIRYSIFKPPSHTIVDVWNATTKRYEPAEATRFTDLIKAPEIITKLKLKAGTGQWSIEVENPEGIRYEQLLSAVFNLYHEELTPEEKEYHYGETRTESFQDWFEYRCQNSMEPVMERARMTLRRIDLLRGNVFYKGIQLDSDGYWQIVMYSKGEYNRRLHTKMSHIKLNNILISEPHTATRTKRASIRFNVTEDPHKVHVKRWNRALMQYESAEPSYKESMVKGNRFIPNFSVRGPSSISNHIFPCPSKPQEGIRCIDVFDAIFKYFRCPLSPEERERHRDIMQPGGQFQTWFDYRCRDSEDEQLMGPRRVDLLQGKVFYRGLKHIGKEEWEIQMYTE